MSAGLVALLSPMPIDWGGITLLEREVPRDASHQAIACYGAVRAYNQHAKQHNDVRLILWLLPKQSPWLNPIEAHWVHGKRAVLEPGDHTLTVPILRDRLGAHFHVSPIDLIPNLQC
jgi:hypothetical protein